MISKEYKTVFIHIPKNAGTSICKFFQEKQISICEQPKLHSDINDIKNGFPQAYKNYRKFAVVRNPYDRMVSWYFYLRENAKLQRDFDFDLIFSCDFDEWLKNPTKYWLPMGRLKTSRKTNKEYSFSFLECQHVWLDDTVKVLKYENLNEELNSFFGEEINLPIMNKTNHKHYLEYYDKESLDVVYNKYKEDFEKYNYKKL